MSATEESTVFRWFRGGSLDALLVFLRRNDFHVGASEAIDAARLVGALAQQAAPAGLAATDAVAWLAPKLRPVFCKNREDQQRFDALFAEWANSGVYVQTPTSAPPADISSAPRNRQHLMWWLPVVVLLIVAFYVYRAINAPPPETAVPPATPAPAAATVEAPLPAAVPPLPASRKADAPFDGFYPQIRYHQEWQPWVGGALLGLLGVALCALAWPFAAPWLGHAQRSGRPIALDDSSLRREAERIVPPLTAEVAARLARHVPGPVDSGERLQRRPPIDVERTIAATLAQLGILRLRYRRARLTPSYLLLVDGDEQNDPRSRLFYHWAQRLQREGIAVDIRLLRYDAPSGQLWLRRPGGKESETFDRWPTPPVGQRLIVISDGTPLVDENDRPRDWLRRAQLHRWPERVLFTPREPRRWDTREAAIERPERSADPGFIVLPIDENALAAWAELIVSGQLPDFALSRPQRYPQLLRRLEDAGEEAALLADSPPFSAPELADLIAQIKLYLGENGYYWLCVCAVPPIVRWQLTLLLGEQYLRNAGVDEAQLAAFIARYYGRLAGLPWLRRQKMPDWLRLALLDSLPDALQDEVRQAVLSRLGQLEPADSGGETLQLEEPPGALGRVNRVPAADGKTPGDTLYLGFLAGQSPRQLMLRAPGPWSAWLAQLPSPRRHGGWRARLRALRDRLFWRDGLSFLGRPRRFGWLLALTAVVVGGVGWRLGDPENLPPAWRTVVYRESARAVALPQSGRTDKLLFSPDGQRLLTADKDGRQQLWAADSGQPLGAPLAGQSWPSLAVFSPDGRRLVSLAGERRLAFHDGLTGEPLGAVDYLEPIAAVAFAPGGLRVVTGDRRASRLWDGDGGRLLAELSAAEAGDLRIHFNIDGSRVVIVNPTVGTILLWDTQTGEPTNRVELSDTAKVLELSLNPQPTTSTAYSVGSIVFSPDRRLMAVVLLQTRVHLWDIESGQRLRVVLNHQTEITQVRFSPDSRRLLTASSDGDARLWDVDSGQSLGEPLRHGGAVSDAQFSPDGRWIATAGVDGNVRLWDGQSGQPLGGALPHPASVNRLAFSPDGGQLATASFEQAVRLWSVQAPSPLARLPQAAAQRRATFSPDGERLLTAGGDGSARLWDSRRAQPLGAPLRHAAALNDAVFSADGVRVLTASDDRSARLWNAMDGQPLGAPLTHQGAVLRAAFSPDGQRAVTASADRQARLWDGRSGQPLGVPMAHADTVNDAVFSADGRRVLTASDDGTARLWDGETGQPLDVILVHPAPVTRAAFCADDERIVTVSLDQRARLWGSRRGTLIGQPMRHPTTISDVACRADGRRIVTASLDNSARLWDGETGQATGVVLRHDDAVRHAEFSADGRRVLTASDDGSARLWDSESGAALTAPLRHAQAVPYATFSTDGQRIVTAWGMPASTVPLAAPKELTVQPTPNQQQTAPSTPPPSKRNQTATAEPAVAKKARPTTDKSRVRPSPGTASGAPPVNGSGKAQSTPGDPTAVQGTSGNVEPANLPAPNAPASSFPERAPQQQQKELPRGPSGAAIPGNFLPVSLFSIAWAESNSAASVRQSSSTTSPAQAVAANNAEAVTLVGADTRGGAALWQVPPDPLPMPQSRPEWPFGTLLVGLLVGYIVAATTLAWRSRRRLRALSAIDDVLPLPASAAP